MCVWAASEKVLSKRDGRAGKDSRSGGGPGCVDAGLGGWGGAGCGEGSAAAGGDW